MTIHQEVRHSGDNNMTLETTNPLLQLRSVSKSYDNKHLAVADVNVSVRPGEFISFLGPSGSGKTSTLMMVAGFETPSVGNIELEGIDVTRLAPQHRGMGMVFQNYALFPHMTVAQNVAFPLSIRGASKQEIADRVKSALEMVHLGNVVDRKPSQLSGGQQQRVAIARALVFNPKLVLMDEPLGALDRQLREEMQMELSRLHRELALTILYVTHDQSEAMTMSGRVAVFNHGKIVQLAPPNEIYSQPADAFVAGFVGDNNRLSATILDVSNGETLIELTGGGQLRLKSAKALSPGQPVDVFIRCEDLSFSSADSRDVQHQQLPGSVLNRVFHGDHYRNIVELGGAGKLVVKTASNQPSPATGDGCTIKVDTGSISLFPA